MSIKATIQGSNSIRASLQGQNEVTANTVGIIPVLNGNTTLNGALTINGAPLTVISDATNSSTKNSLEIHGNYIIGQYHEAAAHAASTIKGDSIQLVAPTLNNLYHHNKVADSPITDGANISLFGALPSTATRFDTHTKAFYNARTHTFRSTDKPKDVLFTIDTNLLPNQLPSEATVPNSTITSFAPHKFTRGIKGDLTLIDSPSNTGGVLRVRSSGSDPDPNYNNIRVEGSDSILTAGQLKIWKPVTDAGNEETGEYGFEYDGSNNKLLVKNVVHGDGSAAGPVTIEAQGSNATLNVLGNASGFSSAEIAQINVVATNGAAQLNLTSSGQGGSRVKIEHTSTGEIFQAFGLGSDLQNTGTIQLGGESGFRIRRTFSDPNYLHSITAPNLSIGPATLESPMTTGAITVTRAGATYANAPRVDLIDSDGTNQRCSFINSGGNLQLEARNGSTKGIISFLQNADGVRTTAFKISSGGNVGVNITNPQEKLHVDGNGRIDGNFYADVGSNTFTVRADTNNVGIGTSTPDNSKKLVVIGDSKFVGGSIVGASSSGNAALTKQNCYFKSGGIRLQKAEATTDEISMRYESATSNNFIIEQIKDNAAKGHIKFVGNQNLIRIDGPVVEIGQTGTVKLRGTSVLVGESGQSRALKIMDSRTTAHGLHFEHSNASAGTIQMGWTGSYPNPMYWRLVYKSPTNPSTDTEMMAVRAANKITFSKLVRFGSYTTAERDAATTAGYAENGVVIYNSTTNKFQGYANSVWVDFH